MDEPKPERQDGSQPERGTGQRQDHRAAPPGHEIPAEPPDLDEQESAEEPREEDHPSTR